MKKCLLFCLAALLFCELFLFGCAPKSKVKPLSLPQYSYEGKILSVSPESGTKLAFRYLGADAVWKSEEDRMFYSLLEDESFETIEIKENDVAQRKEFVFNGFTYSLRYEHTIVCPSLGKQYEVYGLLQEDLTQEMLAFVPEEMRYLYLVEEKTPRFVSSVIFDKSTGEVHSISALPNGYFLQGDESEAFLKQKALSFASPYTMASLENRSVEIETNGRQTLGFFTKSGNYTPERYVFRLDRLIDGKQALADRVEVIFANYGTFIYYYSTEGRSYTASQEEKIAKADVEYIQKQRAASVAESLSENWKLTGFEVISGGFDLYENELYYEANVKVTLQCSKPRTLADGEQDSYRFFIKLRAEIV